VKGCGASVRRWQSLGGDRLRETMEAKALFTIGLGSLHSTVHL
jgi:hypothetical protein